MSVILALIGLAQVGGSVATPPPVSRTSSPAPPTDWSVLPNLQYVRRFPPLEQLSRYVRDETLAKRCAAAIRSTSGYTLRVDLAVLVTPAGQIRRIVPRAIDCVTVEQYASGLVSRLARDNIDASGLAEDSWLRTSLTFAWAG